MHNVARSTGSCSPAPSWQPWRDIEIIAGTPVGGGQDRAARALASALEGLLNVQVIVTNVPGRGGGNAWDQLVSDGGDGHRLSISSPTLITNRLTGVSDLQLDTLTQIALLYSEFILFAVPATSPLSTAKELIEALASPTPPTISLATARGNINHIALANLCRHAQVPPGDIGISVFDSAPDAIADALTHPAGVAAVSAASVVPEFLSGSLRTLAVSAPSRLGDPFGLVPTFAELGVDCTIGVWRGVVGPPDLEPEIESFWGQTIGTALGGAEWQASLKKYVWSGSFLGPAETADFVEAEDERMQSALSDLGLA